MPCLSQPRQAHAVCLSQRLTSKHNSCRLRRGRGDFFRFPLKKRLFLRPPDKPSSSGNLRCQSVLLFGGKKEKQGEQDSMAPAATKYLLGNAWARDFKKALELDEWGQREEALGMYNR